MAAAKLRHRAEGVAKKAGRNLPICYGWEELGAGGGSAEAGGESGSKTSV